MGRSPHRTFLPLPGPLTPVAAVLWALGTAHAAEIDTGNPDLSFRWDNTVKLSTAYRLKSASSEVLANPNGDDGDRNFGKGVVSGRADLFTEMDLVYQRKHGARISGAAYYDAIYNRRNDNPGFAGGAFPNQLSVAPNEFTKATRELHGRKAELLDAFAFGQLDLDGMTLTARAGRHAILWGESLFFGGNAIAGGQQPVDVVKLLSVPNTQFKEAIRPVPQVSASLQINSAISIAGYVQTAFKPSLVPASGSYFSNADPGIDGGETILLGPGVFALRQPDKRPSNQGQWGLQLKLRGDGLDYGLYAVRFHSKLPQAVPLIGLTPAGPAPIGYYLGYHEGVKAFGFSVSKTIDEFNLALEVSTRRNQDLASSQSADVSSFTPAPATNVTDNPAYATGNTAHVNLSMLGNLPATPLWREATLLGELAWNRVLSVTHGASALDPNGTRDGVALRVTLEPMYRGVLDGVDVGVPVTLGWAPRGSRPLAMSSPNAWVADGGGDLTLGANLSLRDVWRMTLSYTHYFGRAKPFQDPTNANAYTWQQSFRDRDFLAASLRYTF